MEFNERLQQLRKERGLTQEELAEKLFVSRTAVSKWESGRGYPNIDSLKAIARFYGVTVDELLSSGEVLKIAESDQKQKESHFGDLVFGFIDICAILLIFLPFFADKGGDAIRSVSLLQLHSPKIYILLAFYDSIISTCIFGVMTLAFQNCKRAFWTKSRRAISIALSSVSVLLFTLCMQPYVAIFAFVLLIFKALMLIKRK
jgi:transcriptional regulator with XRE-family HTH domain